MPRLDPFTHGHLLYWNRTYGGLNWRGLRLLVREHWSYMEGREGEFDQSWPYLASRIPALSGPDCLAYYA